MAALPTLSPKSASAGACDHQTVSASDQHRQLSAAVLFVELDAKSKSSERHTGSVCWSLDLLKTAGQPDKLVVHADVDIPDIAMKLTMDFSRNTDRSTAASHFIALTFEQPSNAAPSKVASGEVVSVPGMLLKSSERSRGAPLAGLGVKTAQGSFLVLLSESDDDRRRNLQLLKEQSWFDIPMVYASRHRAILAIEKGHRGEQMFRDAIAHWEQTQ